MLHWLFFFFIAVGAKLILALVTIYLLFPSDNCCNNCDGETLLLQMGRSGRAVSRLLLGTLQRRWCPRCGWEGLARTGRLVASGSRANSDSKARSRHLP